MSQATEPATLELRSISMRFAGVHALDDISFTVAPGSVHALIGPNGAGKSTCLNVISGLYRPTAGAVLLDDENILDRPPHQLPHLGIARTFQNLALSATQTVRETMLLGRYAHTRTGFLGAGLRARHAKREERDGLAAVERVAERLNLTDRLNTPVGELPYGGRKRLELARALCMEPRLLLLDEPVAGMPNQEAHAIAETIADIRRNFPVTVLLIDHNMGVVMSLADRVTVVDCGRFIADGTPAQVQSNPDVLRVYLGESPSTAPSRADR